jgi:hypothetical protein
LEKLKNGDWSINLPYKVFHGGKPQMGVVYTVQVRFGDDALWPNAGTGIDFPVNFTSFSNWRQGQVTAIPSRFGEWSNVQTVYCHTEYFTNIDYNFDDFVPEVVVSGNTAIEDPIS